MELNLHDENPMIFSQRQNWYGIKGLESTHYFGEVRVWETEAGKNIVFITVMMFPRI